MSVGQIKHRLSRLLELIDKEVHKQNTTISADAYLDILKELSAAYEDASETNSGGQLIFMSHVLEGDMLLTGDHLGYIDSFVDSVENIMRVESSIERHKADKIAWEDNHDVAILKKYEEDVVLSYVITTGGNFQDLDCLKINALKLAGVKMENEHKFLESQFLRLNEWYKQELHLECLGLKNCWSNLKMNWSEFQKMFKFIQRTYKSMEYIRKHGNSHLTREELNLNFNDLSIIK